MPITLSINRLIVWFYSMKVFFCINIFVSNFSMILLKTIVSFLYRKFTFISRGLNLNLNRLYISIMVSRYVLFLLIFYLVKKIKYNNTIKIKSVSVAYRCWKFIWKVLYGIVSIYECQGVIFDTRLKLFIRFICLSWDSHQTFPPVKRREYR